MTVSALSPMVPAAEQAARRAPPSIVQPADAPAWQDRLRTLEQDFATIQHTRMQGLGLLTPGLRVQAVGFVTGLEAAAPHTAWGVLITPWFMNLMRLELLPTPQDRVPPMGVTVTRRVGGREWELQGGHASGFGAWEAVSLISPMDAFRTQADAVAFANAVMAQLCIAPALRGEALPEAGAPKPGQALEAASTPSRAGVGSTLAPTEAPVPSRRGFLRGRWAGGGA